MTICTDPCRRSCGKFTSSRLTLSLISQPDEITRLILEAAGQPT
jgi:hypothetical protein